MKTEYENVINHLKVYLKYIKAFEMKEEFSRAITALSQQPMSGEGKTAEDFFVGDKQTWYEESTGTAMIPMDRAINLAEMYAASLTPNKGLTAEDRATYCTHCNQETFKENGRCKFCFAPQEQKGETSHE